MGMLHDRGNAVPFHGDHHPVKVSTHRKSRNLLKQSIFNTEVNGITFSTDEDGTITVNGKPNTTGAYYCFRDFPAGTYTISVRFLNPLGSESNKHIGVRVRNKDNKQYVQLVETGIDYASAQVENEAYQQLKIGILVSKDIIYDNYKLQIQFEEGPEATSFEPYGLIEEPIFEPIDQAQDGKTLTFENTYNDVAEVTVFGESTQETLSGSNLHVSGKSITIPVDGMIAEYDSAKDTYAFKGTSDSVGGRLAFSGYRYFTLDAGTYVMSVAHTAGSTPRAEIIWYVSDRENNQPLANCFPDSSASFTLSKQKTLIIGANIIHTGTTFDDVYVAWVNSGTTATEYEPYCGGIPSPNPDYPQPIESIKSVELVSSNADGSKSATRTIDLQGHELRYLPDGTHDELVVHRDGTVELVQRVGEYDFGDGSWIYYERYDGFYSTTWFNEIKSSKTENDEGNMLCEHFHTVSDKKFTTAENGTCCKNILSMVKLRDTRFTDSMELKSAWTGKKFYTERNEPQTIQLPSIDPLPTYHPYTFVDGNGADISASVKVIP